MAHGALLFEHELELGVAKRVRKSRQCVQRKLIRKNIISRSLPSLYNPPPPLSFGILAVLKFVSGMPPRRSSCKLWVSAAVYNFLQGGKKRKERDDIDKTKA
jgi:hypothetical protein